MNSRRLYRCRHDRQLAGVAAGLAEYLDLDPTVVRVLWILSIFFGGFTILLYIVLAFVMPLEPLPVAAGPAPTAPVGGPAGSAAGYGPAAGFAAAAGPEAGVAGDVAGEAGSVASDPAAQTATAMWTAPDGTAVPAAWAVHAAPAVHAHARRGEGRIGLVAGVMLVVLGAIALVGPLFPGWVAGIAFWPAFILALGVGLLVVAVRRPTADA